MCGPVRIAVRRFAPTRSLRRVPRRNADISVEIGEARATAEQYRLFRAYQRGRHGSSDMADMSFADYRGMVEETPVETWLVEGRDADGTLVSGLLADRASDSLSAAYSFFDPAQPQRSLGTLAILWLVEHARALELPWVYLGYWRSEEHTSELQSLMRISYAVFCLKKKINTT